MAHIIRFIGNQTIATDTHGERVGRSRMFMFKDRFATILGAISYDRATDKVTLQPLVPPGPPRLLDPMQKVHPEHVTNNEDHVNNADKAAGLILEAYGIESVDYAGIQYELTHAVEV